MPAAQVISNQKSKIRNLPMASSKQAALGFIFITILIDVIGFGIIIPVMPKLIEDMIHGDLSAASKWGG